jgi:hypothetical protein
MTSQFDISAKHGEIDQGSDQNEKIAAFFQFRGVCELAVATVRVCVRILVLVETKLFNTGRRRCHRDHFNCMLQP